MNSHIIPFIRLNLSKCDFYQTQAIEFEDIFRDTDFPNWFIDKFRDDGIIEIKEICANRNIPDYILTLFFKSEEDKTMFILKYL